MTTRDRCDQAFARMRPAKLNDLSAAMYERRGAGDLARILASSPGEVPPRRRPALLRPLHLGGLAAVTGAAALALVVGTSNGTPPGGDVERLDGSQFLLASATKLEQAPEDGKCWYVRQYDVFDTDLEGPIRLGEATPGPGASQMLERWECRGEGSRTRITYPEGSEDAKENGRGDNDYPAGKDTYGLGTVEVPGEKVRSIADAQSLERLVKDAYAREKRKDWEYDGFPSWGQYVWTATWDLMTSDVPPKTKAAIYRLLAGLDGIDNLGEREDQLGRTGVAISFKITSDNAPKSETGESIILFNSETGELMAELTGQQVAVEKTGWVGKKGQRP